ncbi:MAG: HAD family phosphatase [Oscillospiraceae bacterium]|nr:HAD family phosphatase [Oscillospiraceae bacterium]
MAIKLIALDIDGTLMNSHLQVTEQTIRTLTEAAEKGIAVVLSTGRPEPECDDVIEKVPCISYVNGCTGARVVDVKTGKIIAGRYIPVDEAKRLREKLRDLDLVVCAADPLTARFHDDARELERAISLSSPDVAAFLAKYHVGEEDLDAYLSSIDKIVKFYMPCFSEGVIEEVKRRMEGEPYTVLQCGPNDVEICPAGTDKGTGLSLLAQALGITAQEVMAIGDSENDLSMLRYAGLPVCMGNGSEAAKACAKYITDDNDHDGVAKAVNMVLEGLL